MRPEHAEHTLEPEPLTPQEELDLLQWAGADEELSDVDITSMFARNVTEIPGLTMDIVEWKRTHIMPKNPSPTLEAFIASEVLTAKISRFIRDPKVVMLRNGWNLKRTHVRFTRTDDMDNERWWVRHNKNIIAGPYGTVAAARRAYRGGR